MSEKYFSSGEHIEKAIDKKAKREYRKKLIIKMIVEIAVAALLIYVLFGIVFGVAIVKGDSMMPSISKGSPCIFLRIDTGYLRGDAVIFTDSNGKSTVKRIVAVGGDKVDLVDGKLYVNGVEENRVTTAGETFPYEDGITFPITVERDSVFVLGDNREGAVDSRVFGDVKKDIITGRILLEFKLFGR